MTSPLPVRTTLINFAIALFRGHQSDGDSEKAGRGDGLLLKQERLEILHRNHQVNRAVSNLQTRAFLAQMPNFVITIKQKLRGVVREG